MNNKESHTLSTWVIKVFIIGVLYWTLVTVSDMIYEIKYAGLEDKYGYEMSIAMSRIYLTIPFAVLLIVISIRNMMKITSGDTIERNTSNMKARTLNIFLSWIVSVFIILIAWVVIGIMPLPLLSYGDSSWWSMFWTLLTLVSIILVSVWSLYRLILDKKNIG